MERDDDQTAVTCPNCRSTDGEFGLEQRRCESCRSDGCFDCMSFNNDIGVYFCMPGMGCDAQPEERRVREGGERDYSKRSERRVVAAAAPVVADGRVTPESVTPESVTPESRTA